MQEGLDSLTQLNSDADVTYGSDDGSPSQGPGEQQRNGGDTAWAIRSGGRGKTPGYQQPLLIASSLPTSPPPRRKAPTCTAAST